MQIFTDEKECNKMNGFAAYSIPAMLALSGILVFFSKKQLFQVFLSGCADGLKTAYGILPSLILLVVAVRMFRESGGMAFVCNALAGVCGMLKIPVEIVPTVLMRAVSGSGATASAKELFETSGPDSLAGRAVSILLGSSDTILYTFSVYFAHTKIIHTRHAMPCAFAVLVFCTVLSCALARLFFA